ncbi:MAG: glycosyltransferase family 4 protein [Planctomycetes bacterium]|nr:glycosyltransferase family 4 protein [Planctomycetota bacterium]
MTPILLFVLTSGLSACAVGAALVYARQRLLDLPNQRSSHERPTPRGGGIGLVAALVATAGAAAWMDGAVRALPILAALVVVAALGWWDDHRPLSARFRLAIQALAAAVVIAALPLPGEVVAFGWLLPVGGAVGWVVALAAAVWIINLTNFMDGIDGIAGTQGFVAGLAYWVVLGGWSGSLAVACAGSCLGFLAWNWPPARIFLGDVGSTTLGLVFVVMMLACLQGGLPVEAVLLPIAPFFADATATLLRRAWNREHLATAHRSHLYQRLAARLGSHRVVTCLYAGLAVAGGVGAIGIARGWWPGFAASACWLLTFTACAVAARSGPGARVAR